jgi:hypothetical protein
MLRKRNDCEGDIRARTMRPEVRCVHGTTRTIAAKNGGNSIEASFEDGFMCVAQERSVLDNIYIPARFI